MTDIGQTVFGIYCLITVLILAIKEMKSMSKEESEGWGLVALIPLVIFLVNVI